MAAALKKCKELGFDTDRGIVPLQETFINLSSARFLLEDAIENQKLIQLPITVQKEILLNLQSVSKSVQGLTAGTDEVVNVTTSVESLNTSIWKYGLHNLSDQVLGYEKKLNQVKILEVQLSKAISELDAARKAAEKAEVAAKDIEQRKADATAVLEDVKQISETSTKLLEQTKSAEASVSALHLTVQQQEKQSGELTSHIKTSNNELVALDASIRKFYGEVEEYRNKINKTSEEAAELIRASGAGFEKLVGETKMKVEAAIESLHKTEVSVTDELTKKVLAHISKTEDSFAKMAADAQSSSAAFQKECDAKLQATLAEDTAATTKLVDASGAKLQSLEKQLNERSSETIEANQEKTSKLIEDLAKLENTIREQIQQATGFTLFGAFQARQNQIAGSKKVWAGIILVLVVISAGVTAWIAHEAKDYRVSDVALWVKLSLTIPLGFAIAFCTVQYNRERRLEEEYAFKSSISVSLNPYRDLIHSMLEKDGTTDQTRYTQFVIDSVSNVFTPPTDKIFENEKKPGLTAKTFKQAAEIIGAGVKASK